MTLRIICTKITPFLLCANKLKSEICKENVNICTKTEMKKKYFRQFDYTSLLVHFSYDKIYFALIPRSASRTFGAFFILFWIDCHVVTNKNFKCSSPNSLFYFIIQTMNFRMYTYFLCDSSRKIPLYVVYITKP